MEATEFQPRCLSISPFAFIPHSLSVATDRKPAGSTGLPAAHTLLAKLCAKSLTCVSASRWPVLAARLLSTPFSATTLDFCPQQHDCLRGTKLRALALV